eukprot:2100156-Rhodomonas_salina.1
MCGTELAYAAIIFLGDVRFCACVVLSSRMLLPPAVLSERMLLSFSQDMCGTERAYAATRSRMYQKRQTTWWSRMSCGVWMLYTSDVSSVWLTLLSFCVTWRLALRATFRPFCGLSEMLTFLVYVLAAPPVLLTFSVHSIAGACTPRRERGSGVRGTQPASASSSSLQPPPPSPAF